MTLDQLEELIRKYLAMGVTVVVILTGVQPGAGVSAAPSSARSSVTASAARPSIIVPGTSTAVPSRGAPRTGTPVTGTPGTGKPSTGVADTGVADTAGASGSDPGSTDRSTGPTGPTGTTGAGAAGDTSAAPVGGGSSASSVGDGSAAAEFGWGTPDRVEDFSAGTGAWDLYNGPGHDGKGTRSPSAVSIADGIMTITGSPDGTTEGMAWNPGQKFGRWEARVRSPAGDSSYHAVLLLWPDAENWPAGGEVDFMEISDETRQTTDMFLHYGADNSQKSGSVAIDATQWHDWAVEWTPQGITAFVDGTRWWSTTDTSILPPGPMHMTIQLDWFPEGGAVKQTQMSVDWVRQYPVGA